MKFICLGNLNIDISFYCDRIPKNHEKIKANKTLYSFGGGACNTAYWLSKYGKNVCMIGCCGLDEFGNNYLKKLNQDRINTSYLQRSIDKETNITAIIVPPNNKVIISSGGANKDLEINKIPKSIFGIDTHMHISYSDISKVKKVVHEAKSYGTIISIEIKKDYDLEIFEWVDYCFINQDDFLKWFGDGDKVSIWNKIKGDSMAILVVTLGSNGAIAILNNETFKENAVLTDVVDRTGGGDAFNAGFIYSIYNGNNLNECLMSGLKMASSVIANEGAQPDGLIIHKINKE